MVYRIYLQNQYPVPSVASRHHQWTKKRQDCAPQQFLKLARRLYRFQKDPSALSRWKTFGYR